MLPAAFCFLDASFLLTVEVFLLTVSLFTCSGGTVSREDQTQFPDGGGTVSKPIFDRKQKGPNRISTISRKDQTGFTASNKDQP